MTVQFITAQDLAQHLAQDLTQHRDWLILDASYYLKGGVEKAEESFKQAAIPGAKFWNINACADPHSQLPHMLAPELIFAHFLTGSQWQAGQPICIYDQQGLFSAPRLAWEFLKREVGADIYLLQGGLPAWQNAGLDTVPGAVVVEPKTPDPSLWWQDAFVASYAINEVFDELQFDPSVAAQIVDARPPGRFAGTEPEPRAGLRSGHIPGSINLPNTSVIKDGKFADDFDLRGLNLAMPIITTCGSGITAAGLALALEGRGAEHVVVYDGSWTQWGDPCSMTPVITD